MVDEATKSRLGRGLAALLGDADEDFGPGAPSAGTGSRRVPIEFIRRNPRNPRAHFADDTLTELTDSIRERGIIQPIVVRTLRDIPDVYEIIAGERRWRAAQRAGLHDVPVVIVEADDRLALELALIENVQRADLNPLEEAAGYERLVGQHGYTQSDLATTLGKSRSHVANTLRLLKLPERVRDMLARGELSAGHGRALLSLPDPDAIADRVVAQGLTVRDVERLGQASAPAGHAEMRGPGRPRRTRTVSADTRAVERTLSEALGLTVTIDHRGDQGGEVRIGYATLEQLEAVCVLLRSARP